MEKELLDVTKKSGLIFAGGLVSNSLSLIFNLIVVRTMGVKNYGEFTYAFAVISLFPVIGALALNKGLTYTLPRLENDRKIDEAKGLIGFCLLIALLFSSFLASMIYRNVNIISAYWLNKPGIAELLKSLVPLSVPMALLSVLAGVFVGIGKVKTLVKIQNIYGPVIRILALLLFAFLSSKVWGLVAAMYISTIGGLLLFLGSLLRENLFSRISLQQIDSYKQILFFSLPLLVAAIVSEVAGKINLFMIGYFLNAEHIGVYNIATKVASLSTIVMTIISSMFAPVISALYYRGEIEKLGGLFKITTKWMVAGNLVVLSLVLLFSAEIMRIFGNELIYGSTVLIILTLGQVINAGTGAAGSINIMTGHSAYELYTNILVLGLIVIMNYWLIPIYGIIGAALTFAVALGITNIVRVILVYRDHWIHPYSWEYIKVIGASVLSFGLVWGLKWALHMNWLLEMTLLSFVYLGTFVILNIRFGLSKDDQLVLDKILGKIYRRGKDKPEITAE